MELPNFEEHIKAKEAEREGDGPDDADVFNVASIKQTGRTFFCRWGEEVTFVAPRV